LKRFFKDDYHKDGKKKYKDSHHKSSRRSEFAKRKHSPSKEDTPPTKKRLMSLTEAIRERKVMTTISRTVKRVFLDAIMGRFPIPENGSRGTMKRKVAQMLAINVTISSSEAEYRTLAQETCEGQWLLYLLHDFLVPHSSPIIMIYCDNQSAKHMAANPNFS
jgi:hypothetical protein